MMGLVIAGGQSVRMGQNKATLIFRGKPLFARAADAMRRFTQRVYISARPDSPFLKDLRDTPLFDELVELGPGSALIAAHLAQPLEDFLVVACDFPHVDAISIQTLLTYHGDDRKVAQGNQDFAITCYVHPSDSAPEPLFAVWSAKALAELKLNFDKGQRGPMATLRKLDANGLVQKISPPDQIMLLNTNTPAEWNSISKT